MKFIHIADVHWGARPEREQTFGRIREQEIKETFQRVIDHANKQQVDLLLIAGDLFDQPPTQGEIAVPFRQRENAVEMVGQHHPCVNGAGVSLLHLGNAMA